MVPCWSCCPVCVWEGGGGGDRKTSVNKKESVRVCQCNCMFCKNIGRVGTHHKRNH